MKIVSIITLNHKGIIAFSDPVIAMAVYSEILDKDFIAGLEFSYHKEYNAVEVFKFNDLYNQIGWNYITIRGNECFVNYPKDTPKKIIRKIGFHLQNVLSSYEKSNYRNDE